MKGMIFIALFFAVASCSTYPKNHSVSKDVYSVRKDIYSAGTLPNPTEKIDSTLR